VPPPDIALLPPLDMLDVPAVDMAELPAALPLPLASLPPHAAALSESPKPRGKQMAKVPNFDFFM
jgi:hypothetical protein